VKPIEFEHSNDIIGGEVPVNRVAGMLISVWQGTWRERLTFLLTGKVVLCISGNAMPPVLLSADKMFRIVNPPVVLEED